MREKLARRARFLADIRRFFAERQVLEVDTPLLVAYGVTDVTLHSLAVAEAGFLITSPEYAMKRLLAAGSGDIYQLSHVFRGEESGRRHLREFTLLEWYRCGFDHHDLIREVAALIAELLDEADLPVRLTPYGDLFAEGFALDLFAADDAEIAAVARTRFPEAAHWNMDRDSWLDLLFTHFIEPDLGHEGVQFVVDYPLSQAGLSRSITNAQGQPVAARFEGYITGVEVCNGFWELTDADEQRARFARDNAMRRAAGLLQMPIDETFIAALEAGLPECAGVALGVDRLLMLAVRAAAIQDVVCSGFDEPGRDEFPPALATVSRISTEPGKPPPDQKSTG